MANEYAPSSHSSYDPASDAESQWDSSSDSSGDDAMISTTSIAKTLIRSVVQFQQSYKGISYSFRTLAKQDLITVMETAIRFLEETYSLRSRDRLRIYELLFDSVLVHMEPHSSALILPGIRSNQLKAFILRVVSDIEKFTTYTEYGSKTEIYTIPVQKMSKLIACISVIDFDELVVGVLLSGEYIHGKPTIHNVTVQESIVEIFSSTYSKNLTSGNIQSTIIKLTAVPAYATNYSVISAVVRGIQNAPKAKPLSQDTLSVIPILLDSVLSVNQTGIATDSIEAALLLLSLLPPSMRTNGPLDPIITHLAEVILTIGTRGKETEDLREIFLTAIKIFWDFHFDLIKDDKYDELLHLVLTLADDSAADHDVWSHHPKGNDGAEIFLTNISNSNSHLAPMATRALTQIARSKQQDLSLIVPRMIESIIATGDEKFSIMTPKNLTEIVNLIGALNNSLITAMMVSFLLQIIVNPSAVISKRFLRSIDSEDLISLRTAAGNSLKRISSTKYSGENLLATLLDCLESMPTVGVDTVCECVCTIVNRQDGAKKKIPTSQAVIIIIWLLVTIRASEGDDNLSSMYMGGLVSIVSNLVIGTQITLPISGSGEIFSSILDNLPDNSGQFLSLSLETVVSILASPKTVPSTRIGLIEIWGVIVKDVMSEEPKRLDEIINAFIASDECITSSPECVQLAGETIGQLSEFSPEVVADIIENWLISIETKLNNFSIPHQQQSAIGSYLRKSTPTIRGLFVSEKTEFSIQTQIRLKEVVIVAIGEIVASPAIGDDDGAIVSSPSKRRNEFASILLNELVRHKECLSELVKSSPGNHSLNVDEKVLSTTRHVLRSLGKFSPSSSSVVDSETIVTALNCCLSIIGQVGGMHAIAGNCLIAISKLASVQDIEISSEIFTQILEITLHSIVQAVPDTLSSLSQLTQETKFLSERCIEAAIVLKSLFGHVQSWVGFNRLTKAVGALGLNSQVPIVRWICVRIISIVIDDAGTVPACDLTEGEELLDVVALLIGRLGDTFHPVQIEASNAIVKLLDRWEISTGMCSGTLTGMVVVKCLTHRIPSSLIPTFVLALIRVIHDPDPGAADLIVTTIHTILENRSMGVFEDENSAADAVVDGILSHASHYPSPPAPPSHWTTIQLRLVETLKFIAAVRFPIAVRDLLTPSAAFGADKVHAIHSFAREKKTLVFLMKELIERMMAGSSVPVATVALGHVLDCYEDSGVSQISKKYFGQLYCSLLVQLWHEVGVAGTTAAMVKSVIQKLGRASGIPNPPGESVTVENGIEILSSSSFDKLSIAEFIKPFLLRQLNSIPLTIIASQLVGENEQIDMMFLEYFESISECGDSRLIVACLKGFRRIFSRWAASIASSDSLEDIDSHVLRILGILNSLMMRSSDNFVCADSIQTIISVLELPSKPLEVFNFTVSPIMGQLRRIVDHESPIVRVAVFDLIGKICDCVGESDLIDSDESDEHVITEFFKSASDLWIPCVVRTQDTADLEIRKKAIKAFSSIINNAIADEPIEYDPTVDPLNHYQHTLSLVKSEIGECSYIHLNACCYYFLGLSSVSEEIMVAASRLVPVVLEMIPQPSNEAMTSVADIVNKLLSCGSKGVHDILADILVGAKRIYVDVGRNIPSSS